MICFYLLKSLKDSKQYLGSTIDLEKRLKKHYSGQVRSTKFRRPLVLLGYQPCNTVQEAAVLEKKYKRSHGALERAIKNKSIILTKEIIGAGSAQRALPGGE